MGIKVITKLLKFMFFVILKLLNKNILFLINKYPLCWTKFLRYLYQKINYLIILDV